MKHILALDGGGVRGIISATILNQLETRLGLPVHKMFDLVVGTSVGGINALALAKPNPYSAAQIVDFYFSEAPKIFDRSWCRAVYNLGDLTGSKYGPNLTDVLTRYLGTDTWLSQLLTETIIPSFEMTTYQPYFFKRHYALNEPASDFLLRDVAQATASAPTYFNPHKIGDRIFVDGGLFANNPSTPALAEALRLFPGEQYVVLSLGTGRSEPKYPEVGDWGLVRWARPLVNILMDAAIDVDDYKMGQFLPNAYIRLQPEITAEQAILDDASNKHLVTLRYITTQYLASPEGSKLFNQACDLIGATLLPKNG